MYTDKLVTGLYSFWENTVLAKRIVIYLTGRLCENNVFIMSSAREYEGRLRFGQKLSHGGPLKIIPSEEQLQLSYL